ncbi:mechanosensitive ion channel family protein [Ancylobacter rudongensis]|uniref:Small conductance mechanosensitive channel n=1 Tax=Ancylobacter rudongensis TaxID=177413 RepID=A0A1G4R8T2_9HYPH|nr:mechanosensitive ion channel domain-containing protein [Ancylobacter rudongensis]SCW53282.1 small conductance mechanosensitive channel [Ancylobacter rudongensis]
MPLRALSRLLLALSLLAAPLLAGPAAAQLTPPPAAAAAPSPAEAPPGASASDLRALLDTLSDEAARARFLAQLRALVDSEASTAAQPAAESPAQGREDWLSGATQSLGAFSGSVLSLVGEIEQLPAQAGQLLDDLSDPLVLERVGWAVTMVIAVLAAAMLAEYIAKAVLARLRRAIEARPGRGFFMRALLLALRTLIDIVPIAAFAAAAFGVLALVELNFIVRLAVVTVINANVLARLILAGARAVLTPDAPQMRLFPLDHEGAAYGYLWVRRFTYTLVYGHFLLRAAWVLGLALPTYRFLGNVLALFVAGMCIVFILQVRGAVAGRLRRLGAREGRVARLRDAVADFWHVLAIAYVIAGLLVWTLDVDGGFAFLARATLLSILALGLATLVTALMHRAFERVFRLNGEMSTRYPLLEARANRYLPALRSAMQGLVVLVTALVLLEIWGAQPFERLASEAGRLAVGRLISIGVVVFIGLVAWEISTAFADRLRAGNPNSTRLKTLLPFLQNAFRVVLLTLGGLILLSEIGINIAPLLAGAGVLGLAIGFGAQTLVKDVITGVFILMEDTISVGDVVEVGAHAGLVEKITIRTVHMRDFDGNVHSIPFGEVQTVKNMSKDFAYAVVDVRIAYRESIDEALALMAEVAADMVAKGPLAETITEPFEVVGVEALDPSHIQLRGRFKTRPLGQWNVRREFYRRIKAAFDARGIEMPYPHQTVYLGSDKKGMAPPLRVVNQSAEELAAPARARRTAAARAAASTPGPMIEEHPGARERSEDDEEPMLPAIEEQRH